MLKTLGHFLSFFLFFTKKRKRIEQAYIDSISFVWQGCHSVALCWHFGFSVDRELVSIGEGKRAAMLEVLSVCVQACVCVFSGKTMAGGIFSEGVRQ